MSENLHLRSFFLAHSWIFDSSFVFDESDISSPNTPHNYCLSEWFSGSVIGILSAVFEVG